MPDVVDGNDSVISLDEEGTIMIRPAGSTLTTSPAGFGLSKARNKRSGRRGQEAGPGVKGVVRRRVRGAVRGGVRRKENIRSE